MKKILILFAFLCTQTHFLNAQDVFAPAGAEWYYSYLRGFAPPVLEGYLKVWYSNDSIVQGKNCKILKKHLEFPNQDFLLDTLSTLQHMLKDEIIYVNADTVFRLADDSMFYELYHFNANVGDSIFSRVYYHNEGKDTSLTFVVDEVGLVWINGIEKRALRLLTVDEGTSIPPIFYNPNSLISSQYNIIESIGGTEYMFPWTSHWLDFDLITGLRCYSDDFLGSYSSGIADSCDYISGIWVEKESFRVLDIYPNPSSDVIRLGSSADFATYEISNQIGQGIMLGNIDAAKIDIHDLANGIYFLKVQDRDKHFYIAKFVKE